MKRFIFILLVIGTLTTAAQEITEGSSITLDEVIVKGARVVQKVDGQWIYPTKQQIENSANGYSLLAKLSLPHIRVDEVMNSITALTNLGAVQIRINDMIASREDMQTLDMQGIDHIEFIDNPGVRYGEGIGYLINIIVRKPISGYVIGSQLTNTLTAVNGEESLYGKINYRRSEVALSYGLDYHHFKGSEYDEQSVYEMESGNLIPIHRKSLNDQSRNLHHNIQLTYSLSDSNYVFQAKLFGGRDIRPQRKETEMMLDGQPYKEYSSSHSNTPSLDIYYHHDFHRHQSLTANIVGTFIKTIGETENDEGTAYHYDTDGRTYSLWGEGIYENRLKPFTVSNGIQYSQRYSHNSYQGGIHAINDMHTSNLYLFSQVKGYIGKLSYMGGLGANRWYYRQGDTRQDLWLFRPKGTVSYPLTDIIKVSYSFEISQHVSQIALVSNVSIKQNAMETIVGNPEIHPNRVTSHQLKFSCSTPRFTSELQGYYRINTHCNMEKYIRDNGHFYKTQTNADNECSFFYINTYNQWDMIPGKLIATVNGGIYRFFNYGEDYTHTYTSFNGGCSLQAYLGKWTLGAYADNGWNFMEGEHRGHQAPAWYFTCNYQMNDNFSISLYCQHPFSQHPLTNKTEIVSRYVQKVISQHARDYGNMLTLKLSYRLNHGRKYRDIQRTMNHSDSETGILTK
ncbi:MAG: hypothetical protein J6Z18_09205 [Prevotella sp.]|nr:hypothetical protein [Prevotella sp.]